MNCYKLYILKTVQVSLTFSNLSQNISTKNLFLFKNIYINENPKFFSLSFNFCESLIRYNSYCN